MLGFYIVFFIVFPSVKCNSVESLDEIGFRIVGGEIVHREEVPYIVSVQHRKYHICGGSILSDTIIITAGHCFLNPSSHILPNVEDLSIRAGSVTTKNGGQERSVSQLFIHPQYDINTTDYDAAILLLSEKLFFKSTVRPIKIPNKYYIVQPNRYGIISGWGRLNERATYYPKYLHSTKVFIFSNKECKMIYSNTTEVITDQMFCAGDGTTDACEGDSGGPFFLDNMLVGITSWGMNCADKIYPGIYTNIAKVSKWIKHIMEKLQ